MKYIITIISVLLISGCGNETVELIQSGQNGKDGESFSCQQINTSQLECSDGSIIDLLAGPAGKDGTNGTDGKDGVDGKDGADGKDGQDGVDGKDGEDAVALTKVLAPKNKCTQVYANLWVENIDNGKVFDVYPNSKCEDNLVEYCDNVVPVDDVTGEVKQYKGSGTVCWAGNLMLSGVKQNNGDILVHILDFN